MTFSLSEKSLMCMKGVNQDLISVVTLAITLSKVDFAVVEGMRSKDRQAALYKRGLSKTMNSKHLVGEAVDLAVFKDGKPSWDWEDYYLLADAMKEAAVKLGVSVRWGGCWDKPINKFAEDSKVECNAYTARQKAKKLTPFLDGPHFEIVK